MNSRELGDFAANPQDIPFEEWWRVWHFVTALEVKDTGYCRMWIQVADGRRTWHISTARFHFEYRSAAEGVRGSFAIPFAARYVSAVIDVMTSSCDVTLSLGDASSLVFTSSDIQAVYDMPSVETSQTPALESVECTAVVSAERLADVLDVARTTPFGLDVVGYGPPIWCVVAEGRVMFHADWSAYGHGRSTVSVAARTNGTAEFHSGLSVLGRLLRDFTSGDGDDGDGTVTLHVDGPAGTGCRVTATDWVLTCTFIDPVALEWSWPMRRELSKVGIDYVADGERAIEFLIGSAQVRSELHGGPHPVCRISTTVVRGVHPSEFLLTELNDWNKAHAGIKFWWENDKVAAVIDLPCAHLADFVGAANRLAETAKRFASVTSSL